MKNSARSLLTLAVLTACISTLRAEVVINEFQYDDTVGTTDDREFIELYNNGLAPVDISGWIIGGRSGTATNPSATIPAETTLGPGAFYVIGNLGVPNLNLEVPTSFLGNEFNTIELTNSSAALVDAVLYEGSKNTISLTPDLTAQIGTPYWGNHQGVDIVSATGVTLTTIGRFIDGRDTNNNGRDFGLRPGTPGTSNQVGGFISSYSAPNVDSLNDGDIVGGMTGSFVAPRVITPEFATPGLNPNAIPAPVGFSKAMIAWDNAGGGNGAVSDAVFNNGGSFNLQVYLDTNDLPLGSNTGGYRGSEQTFYGIGNIDAFTNLADVAGVLNIRATGGAAAKSANGATGVHWYYEKVGESSAGFGDVSEKLYLIDANDGGESNKNVLDPIDWTILATIDLSGMPSGWHDLVLMIDPNGQGFAKFDNQTFNFTTMAGLVGEFSIGYREFVTDPIQGGIPDYLRPPTYAIPEPGSFGLIGMAAGLLAFRRRRNVAT